MQNNKTDIADLLSFMRLPLTFFYAIHLDF